MKAKLGWALVPTVLATSAFAADVFFSAPPEMREFIKEEIAALHYAPHDVSAIDDALFNGQNSVKARVARGELAFELPAALPPDVQTDLRVGLAGCRARLLKTKDPGVAAECGAELAQTVWQRYVLRVRPERILEFRAPEKTAKGVQFECVTYRPTDNTVSILGPHDVELEPLVRRAVVAMLTQKLGKNGVRPTSDVLPQALPPPIPDLNQGIVQHLAPLDVPAGCRLPQLTIEPRAAPLAMTMNALWAASARGRDEGGEPIVCELAFDAAAGEWPSELGLYCPSSAVQAEIFPGTRFGDASFQAETARVFLRWELSSVCPAPITPKASKPRAPK